MTDWNARYSSKTVGESGIDYSKATPCSPKSKASCGFHKHLDKLDRENREKDAKTGRMVIKDKDHAEIIKKVREVHEKGIYLPREAK